MICLTFLSLLAAICNIADTNDVHNDTFNLNENETMPYSDMFLSEEQLELIIEDSNEDSANASDYDYSESHNVWKGRDLFRWKKLSSLNSQLTEIPYEFNSQAPFEQSVKSEIVTVIKDLNSMLAGCIQLRY